jgi:gluconate kinase
MGHLADIPIPPAIEGHIAVVGVCGSGKSTLAAALRMQGYDARECSQEHSYIADMWQRISRPQVLVYLEASYAVVLTRLYSYVTPEVYQDQLQKLAHALAHASVYVNTDDQAPEQVLEQVLTYLSHQGIIH